MRNGNKNCRLPSVSERKVLTVPMRNGNPTKKISNVDFSVRSYRTYEEWKPGIEDDAVARDHGSYRTYEEWKLKNEQQKRKDFEVLTVPMRNGNPHPILLHPSASPVLTVPMRNGNLFAIDCCDIACRFLPYL